MSDIPSSTSTSSGTTGTASTPSTSTSGTTTGTDLSTRGGSRVAGGGGSGQSALRTQYGTTTIADGVVAKIAALAAREVTGVASLGGGVSNALSGVVGRITGSSGSNEPRTAGVNVEVGETQAAVDLSMQVQYPASIHEVADAVRQNVRDRIEGMTGLDVVEVNIAVVDLVFPGDDQADSADQVQRPSRVE